MSAPPDVHVQTVSEQAQQTVASPDQCGRGDSQPLYCAAQTLLPPVQKTLSLYTLHAHLAKLKRLPKYAWWRQLGSQAIQEIARRIDKGYQRFFPEREGAPAGKTTRRVGPPTFRTIRKAKSFTLTQAGWKLLGGNRLKIGTTVYKFAKSREPLGTIKTVTIKRDPLGDLFVYFSCVVDVQPIDES